MDRIYDTVPPKVPASVRRLFEGHEPYLTWSPKVEGNAIIHGRMNLGLRAGPALTLCALLHEMAHLIEIDDERCIRKGWGLRILSEIDGYPEPATFQASMREIRVFAIQAALAQHLDVSPSRRHRRRPPVDFADMAKCVGFVPDSHFWSRRYDVPYEGRLKAIEEDIRQQSAALSVDALLAEWERKALILKARRQEMVPCPPGKRARRQAL